MDSQTSAEVQADVVGKEANYEPPSTPYLDPSTYEYIAIDILFTAWVILICLIINDDLM